jgi:hypothetical protein
MLRVYLDASGVTKNDTHFVMAGFVTSPARWEVFEEDWARLLAAPRYASLLPVRNGKRYAHAKRLAQWRPVVREAFYGEANYLLRRADVFATGVTFKHADYSDAFRDYPLTVKDSRYGLGFRAALISTCKNISTNHGSEPLAVVVEHGDPNQGAAELIFNRTREGNKFLSDGRRKYNVLSYAVLFKEDWGALQAADLHAYTLLKHMLSPLGPKTGKGRSRYHGDIQLLLQQMMVLHFPVPRVALFDMRHSSLAALARAKAWGARKVAPKGGQNAESAS